MKNKKNKRVMKRLIAFSTSVIIAAGVFLPQQASAQVPNRISYQAVVRNASGNLVVNSTVGIRIQILQTSESGPAVYVETHSLNTNVNGLITLEIGGGTVVSGTFAGIDWAGGPYFIKIGTDIAGGTNYSITGVSQILSIPYALHSKTVASYPETDPLFLAHPAKVITGVNITEWNTAFSWGNHASAGYVNTSGNQTITGNKIFTGSITVLTPVNATDAATKAYVDVLKNKISELQAILAAAGLLVTDIDGNVYKTVKIGTQVWMAENLRTTKLKYGGTIPLVADNTAWSNLSTSGYCWYNNDETTYKATYGALYNWHTVVTGNLCPTGWHVPTDAEWTTLTTYLGGASGAGGKLKETGTVHWSSPNTGATNESGFTALPGGCRYGNGSFTDFGLYGFWWSSTASSGAYALHRNMGYNSNDVFSISIEKEAGFHVRCLKD
jgi:uncharacterized protein (TIGR02145 family)